MSTSNSSELIEEMVATVPQDLQVPLQGELTFTCFLRLPPELRLKIWDEVEATPRVILIENEWPPHKLWTFTCSSPQPPLLHTSRESRSIALQSNKFLHEDSMLYANITTDFFVFRMFAAVDDFQKTLQSQQIKGQNISSVLTKEEFSSRLRHIVIEQQAEQLIGRLGIREGLKKLTFLNDLESLSIHARYSEPDRFSSNRGSRNSMGGDRLDVESIWADVWGKPDVPMLFLTPDRELRAMVAGNINSLQRRLSGEVIEEYITVEEEGDTDYWG